MVSVKGQRLKDRIKTEVNRKQCWVGNAPKHTFSELGQRRLTCKSQRELRSMIPSSLQDRREHSVYMHIHKKNLSLAKNPTVPQTHLSSGSTVIPHYQSQAQLQLLNTICHRKLSDNVEKFEFEPKLRGKNLIHWIAMAIKTVMRTLTRVPSTVSMATAAHHLACVTTVCREPHLVSGNWEIVFTLPLKSHDQRIGLGEAVFLVCKIRYC